MREALYHLHASIGNRCSGKSAGHRYEYLMREGFFAKAGRCAEDFIAAVSGFMPEWARLDPGLYWRMADLHERDKAVLFREIEFAMPHGIPEEERLRWAERMARTVATTEDGVHPFTLALHAGKEGENWNCHIEVSERINDGVARDPAKWFSRAAVPSRKTGELHPEQGGARKTRAMQPTAWLQGVRQSWEKIGNQALALAGREERLDCRSYGERGIEKLPQIHLGNKAHTRMQRGTGGERVEAYRAIEDANRKMLLARTILEDLEKTTKRLEAHAASRKEQEADATRKQATAESMRWLEARPEEKKEKKVLAAAVKPTVQEIATELKLGKAAEETARYGKTAEPFLREQPKAATTQPGSDQAAAKELKMERRGEAVAQFLHRHPWDGATYKRAENWFAREAEILSTAVAPVTGRKLFEEQQSPQDAGLTIGGEIGKAAAHARYCQEKAAQLDRDIAKQRDRRSLMARLQGVPDRELQTKRSEREQQLAWSAASQATVAQYEAVWQQQRPGWEKQAQERNAVSLARNAKNREALPRMQSLREHVLAELQRRERDPLMQQQRRVQRGQARDTDRSAGR